MEDPDRDWKPNGRPQSTIARNFLSELDDLFKIDSSIDVLDRTVHQKKQAVSNHAQELEALEARLRETEERLKQAKSSPPAFARKNSQRRTPIESTFAEQDRARVSEASSPLAQVHTRQKPDGETKDIPGALPDTPTSYSSTEYVLVDRPRTAQME
ncbi:hypothetical protein BCR34DRAFT_575843 [Clohesyomyces aquaticus]|uniref:Uncharacterized protein n=1 Tax=Clohesyomyces aquaticus TaxID=1231657 RepID=A0A1Y1YRF2_9PLEO|nr:hypothetical protein BCR34DRAFT_575843 [Clohesyomyces aquaticus]